MMYTFMILLVQLLAIIKNKICKKQIKYCSLFEVYFIYNPRGFHKRAPHFVACHVAECKVSIFFFGQ